MLTTLLLIAFSFWHIIDCNYFLLYHVEDHLRRRQRKPKQQSHPLCLWTMKRQQLLFFSTKVSSWFCLTFFHNNLQVLKHFTFAMLTKIWRQVQRVRITKSFLVLEHQQARRLHPRKRPIRANLVLEHQKGNET